MLTVRHTSPPSNVLVVYTSEGNFNSDIICESFIGKIFRPYCDRHGIEDLDPAQIVASFAYCGITARNNFHSALTSVIGSSNGRMIHDIVEPLEATDQYARFVYGDKAEDIIVT